MCKPGPSSQLLFQVERQLPEGDEGQAAKCTHPIGLVLEGTLQVLTNRVQYEYPTPFGLRRSGAVPPHQ